MRYDTDARVQLKWFTVFYKDFVVYGGLQNNQNIPCYIHNVTILSGDTK